MTTYSCRAEFLHDVENFFKVCGENGVYFTRAEITPFITADGHTLPDVFVEMDTEAELLALRGVLNKIIDTHVMIETLRPLPLKENSLERDRSFG